MRPATRLNIMSSRPIVVQTTTFNENSGGSIVLHYLVHSLRKMGIEAYVSPNVKERSNYYPRWTKLIHDKFLYHRFKKKLNLLDVMDTPIASKDIIADSIVVYPEIVKGNPLNAKRVVRWLLNKPGFFNRAPYVHNVNEEIFFYQYAFAQGIKEISSDNLLQIRWLRHDIYKNKNLTNRQGSCRMIRKGKRSKQIAIPERDESILIDGMSHVEIAKIFNKSKIFYCHDLYTMYCYYAVLCGCVPVVIPQDNLTKEQWRDGFEMKNGVAYGEDEIDWAIKTREQLILDMQNSKNTEKIQIEAFLTKVQSRTNWG